MKQYVVTVFLLLCAGCSSVPFGTIARLSTFDAEDFSLLNGEELEVRISLPAEFKLNIEDSALEVEADSRAGIHSSAFELALLKQQTGIKPGGLFASERQINIYRLTLSPRSIDKFKRLQRFFTEAPIDNLNIRVKPKMLDFPAEAQEVELWIELQLSKSEGYMTLLDGATLPLNALPKADGSGRS